MPTATVPISQRVRRNFGPAPAVDLSTSLRTAGWQLWTHGDQTDPEAAAIARTGSLRWYSTKLLGADSGHPGMVGYELWFRPKAHAAPAPGTTPPPVIITPTPGTPAPAPIVLPPPLPPPAPTVSALQAATAATSTLTFQPPHVIRGTQNQNDPTFNWATYFANLPHASPWRNVVPQYKSAIPYADNIIAIAQALGFHNTNTPGDYFTMWPEQAGAQVDWSLPSQIDRNAPDGTNFIFFLQRWQRTG